MCANSNTLNDEEILKKTISELSPKFEKYHSELSGFKERLNSQWAEAFSRLELFIVQSQDANNEIYRKYHKIVSEENGLVFLVIFRLHRNACIVAKEILVLMRHGFPEGAKARCRTLEELIVIGSFIAKHGDDVAERYLAHQYLEDIKAAREFQKYRKKDGENQFTDKQMKEMDENFERLLKIYNTPFKESYGWAADVLKNKNPRFSDLVRDVKLEESFHPYRMFSYSVHATSKCFKTFISVKDDPIFTGESYIDMDYPGRYATKRLMEMNLLFLNLKKDDESISLIRSMKILEDRTDKAFVVGSGLNDIEEFQISFNGNTMTIERRSDQNKTH